MSSQIHLEIRVFLVFFCHGAFLMLCSDLLSVWRRAVRHGIWWRSAEDVCFWLAAGIWTFLLVFLTHDGSLRLYMAAAAGVGGLLYRKRFSRWVVKSLSALFFLFSDVLRKCRQLISQL